MYRIVGEIRPDYIIIENSPNLAFRGFERVLCDLSEIGYDAEWQSLPAAAFGAPHLRFRTFVIAYPHSQGNQGEGSPTQRVFRPVALRSFAPAAWGDVSEWEKWVHQPDLCRVPYGFPSIVDRIRSLGNAVVPVVAEYIGEFLMQANNGFAADAKARVRNNS
jgi:DNA (cytosine-5)-methyltransferase 1